MALVSATLQARMLLRETGPGDFSADTANPNVEAILALTAGVAALQADLIYCKQRAVATGANDDIDLAGVLASAFGSTLTFVKVVGLLIINGPVSGAANTTNLTIGAGTNPVTGWLGGTTPTIGPIRPGGFLFRGETDLAGICSVTAATADILRVANSAGATANYQIGILGRSA